MTPPSDPDLDLIGWFERPYPGPRLRSIGAAVSPERVLVVILLVLLVVWLASRVL